MSLLEKIKNAFGGSAPTEEQLAQLLEEKKQADRAAREAERKRYEAEREQLVDRLIGSAKELRDHMECMKIASQAQLEAFMESMAAYGDVPGKETGSFSLISKDKKKKVVYENHRKYAYDERANAAAQHIRDFISVRTDPDTYDLIMSLLARDKDGRFDPRKIQQLYQFEDRFGEESFSKGVALFKESYLPIDSSLYIRFYEADEVGKFKAITLNFSSI